MQWLDEIFEQDKQRSEELGRKLALRDDERRRLDARMPAFRDELFQELRRGIEAFESRWQRHAGSSAVMTVNVEASTLTASATNQSLSVEVSLPGKFVRISGLPAGSASSWNVFLDSDDVCARAKGEQYGRVSAAMLAERVLKAWLPLVLRD